MLTVLTIAGSDCSGGAGIQADLKTFSALGCFSATVITAITAQNSREVRGNFPVPADMIVRQMEAVLDDMKIHAIKVGMLLNSTIIEALLPLLSRSRVPIILDPVMISTTGQRLLEETALDSLKLLFPLATLITPNIPEASHLVDQPIANHSDMLAAGLELLAYGSRAVLIKGGHLQSGRDCLVDSHEVHWFESPFIASRNMHGTGCTLSSAIAAYLAKGYSLHKAVKAAKQYVHASIQAAKELGPLHHFHPFWRAGSPCDL